MLIHGPMDFRSNFRDVSEQRETERARVEVGSRQALIAELGLRALASEDLQSLLDEAVALTARTLEVELVLNEA
jgi:hypothetical protein